MNQHTWQLAVVEGWACSHVRDCLHSGGGNAGRQGSGS